MTEQFRPPPGGTQAAAASPQSYVPQSTIADALSLPRRLHVDTSCDNFASAPTNPRDRLGAFSCVSNGADDPAGEKFMFALVPMILSQFGIGVASLAASASFILAAVAPVGLIG